MRHGNVCHTVCDDSLLQHIFDVSRNFFEIIFIDLLF